MANNVLELAQMLVKHNHNWLNVENFEQSKEYKQIQQIKKTIKKYNSDADNPILMNKYLSTCTIEISLLPDAIVQFMGIVGWVHGYFGSPTYENGKIRDGFITTTLLDHTRGVGHTSSTHYIDFNKLVEAIDMMAHIELSGVCNA